MCFKAPSTPLLLFSFANSIHRCHIINPFLSGMFSAVSSSIERAQETIMGSAGDNNSKVDDLKRDTVDVNDKENVITMDTGVKVSDTDDWLKLSTEHRTGPMLLEDQIAREKV
jgi:catalase